jgi:hypothetical protein
MKKVFLFGLAVFLSILGGTALLLVSCGGGGGGGSSGSSTTAASSSLADKGSVAVLLTDGPADAYSHIWITITEVSLIPADPKAAPVVILNPPGGARVDLLELRKEEYLLAIRDNVPAGLYAKIRLGISEIDPQGGPCTDMSVKLPSGRIDLDPPGPFQVIPGGTLAIRLDLDANISIHLHPAGKSDKCIFRPVVFVDIEEGVPAATCPRVLTGTIESLKVNNGQVVGFYFRLQNDRGTIEVNLLNNGVVINTQGDCASPNGLKAGDEARVRGRLSVDGAFEASMVVVGEVLDVTGEVETDPAFSDSTFNFVFIPAAGQELGGQYQVQGQACTLTLRGCDTLVDPGSIKAGMTVRVFGRLFSQNGESTLRAAAIVLQGQKVSGQVTAIAQVGGGRQATIQPITGPPQSIFIPNGAQIYLEGDGTVPADLLCAGRQVSILLQPGIIVPLTADRVRIQSEGHTGGVTSTYASSRMVVVNLGDGKTETVYVESGATILRSSGENQDLVGFGDIKPGDSVAYFGLPGCGTDPQFYAFVVVIGD